jgi:flagellar capping protein FliD
MPQDIGLKIAADGTLSLDSETFDNAISKDYMATLNLVGAQAVGGTTGSDAAYISFYGAGSHTNAGSYDVRASVGEDPVTHKKIVTGAQIKLSTEDWSKARDMTVGEDGTTLYGKTDCDSSGNPLYPEYSLVLTTDTSSGQNELTTTVNIKQGFGDKLYGMTTDMLKSQGRIPLAENSVAEEITQQQDKIDKETTRLQTYQTNLEAKFARMEATLSQLQSQLSTITAMGK